MSDQQQRSEGTGFSFEIETYERIAREARLQGSEGTGFSFEIETAFIGFVQPKFLT